MAIPPARRRNAQLTRQQIIDATVALFSQRGYRGTSIAAIAKQVGVTDAAVLYHFPTKLDLFRAVVELFNQLQRKRFEAMVQPGGLDAIRNLGQWGAVMQERPDLLRLQVLLSAEALGGELEIHHYFAGRYVALEQVLCSLFQTAVVRGEISSEINVQREVRWFLAFLDGMRVVWLFDDQARPLAAEVEAYVDQLIDRIRS